MTVQYALRAKPIQFALRDGLVVARRDNWCRGFTFLNMPTELGVPDLHAALAHIQADAQRQGETAKGAEISEHAD